MHHVEEELRGCIANMATTNSELDRALRTFWIHTMNEPADVIRLDDYRDVN